MENHAIVVGIDEYPMCALKSLEGAYKDAKEFLDWLQDPEGGDVPGPNIQLIPTEENPDVWDACFSRVQSAFAFLLKKVDQTDDWVGNRLYIYLSGHGIGPGVDDAGLLTAEYSENSMAYLAGRLYADYMRQRAAFREIVLFMDCCRDRARGLPDPPFFFPKDKGSTRANKVQYFYGFAGGYGEKAKELLIDGRTRGVFTYCLLKGLRGAASPGRPVTGKDLCEYVERETATLNDKQDPTFDPRASTLAFTGAPSLKSVVNLILTVPSQGLVIFGPEAEFVPLPAAPAKRMRIELPADRRYLFAVPDAGGGHKRSKYVSTCEERIDVEL